MLDFFVNFIIFPHWQKADVIVDKNLPVRRTDPICLISTIVSKMKRNGYGVEPYPPPAPIWMSTMKIVLLVCPAT